jgi:hypothetical protein
MSFVTVPLHRSTASVSVGEDLPTLSPAFSLGGSFGYEIFFTMHGDMRLPAHWCTCFLLGACRDLKS